MFTPMYLNNNHPVFDLPMDGINNDKDRFLSEEDSAIRMEEPSLSPIEIKSIADKISDKLVKIVENQLQRER